MGDKEDRKKALKEWFKAQDKWKTVKEFSIYLGKPYSTVKGYFSEGRLPKAPEDCERLYQGGDWGQIFPLDKSGLGRGQGGSLGTSLVFQFLSNPFRAGS